MITDLQVNQIFIWWGMGWSVAEIAEELKLAPGTVYGHLRCHVAALEEAEELRQKALGAKYRRIESLADKGEIQWLEKKTKEDFEGMGFGDALKLAELSDKYAKRAALHEGKATERHEIVGGDVVINLTGPVDDESGEPEDNS